MTEAAPIADTETRSAPPALAGKLRRSLRSLWRLTVTLLAVIGFVTVVRPLTFDLTPLASGSMSPTLQGDESGGDWVLAERVSYWFRGPRRWEVVEFHDEEGVQIMKRVIALPGETIAIQNHRPQVNSQELEPPAGAAHVQYLAYGNLSGGRTRDAGDGYYVLGDNSADSNDSRYVGSVTANRISARAWLIVWPPSRMGWVR